MQKDPTSPNWRQSLHKQWHAPCSYAEVLKIAGPMIVTTGAISLQHFCDRTFLNWHSAVSVGASMTSGMLFFTIVCFFMGTVRYVSVFVAQYIGSEKPDQIGPMIWQSLYVSIVGGILVLCLIPFSETIFSWVGHDPKVMEEEVVYFRILCWSGLPILIGSALDSFFTGRGQTRTVMIICLISNGTNVILDYLMIFGKGPFPAMGIAGAAWATVLANVVMCTLFMAILFRRKYEASFHILSGWRFDWKRCRQLCKYGIPGGFHFFIDIVGFTSFILLVGHLGADALNASTIAFNINTLAFMPMIGTGIAVSILVGQMIGAGKPELAVKATSTGLHLTLLYMGIIALSYVVIPNLYLAPFAAKADPEEFSRLAPIAVILLRFVGVYCLVDGFYLIYSSAIKGAGDTRFVMVMQGIMSALFLVFPVWYAIKVRSCGIYTVWFIMTIYMFLLAFVFYLRYKQGKWKTMSVTH